MGSMQGEGTTTIGRGASLRGDLKTTGDIVIEGDLEGSLHAEESRVSVGREARVRADIHAREVVIEGKVVGTIRATERAELRSSSIVEGNVYAKRFAMEENAVLRGNVDPSGGAAPVKTEEAVQAAAPVTPFVRPVQQAPAETSLFTRTERAPGTMPAGLAAAARNLGTAQAPVGMGALADDEGETEHH